MARYLPLKIALSLLAILLFACAAAYVYRISNPTSTKSDITGQNTRSDLLTTEPLQSDGPRGEIKLVPPPIIKQEGNVQGQTSILKFEKDLETSLKIQEVPDLWLEYTDENGYVVKVVLPRKAKDSLRQRWQNTLKYTDQNLSADDRDVKIDIQKSYLNDTAVRAVELEQIEISTPAEKRKISEKEAFELVAHMAKYAIDRYMELSSISGAASRKISY
jgi:hypothetical protein